MLHMVKKYENFLRIRMETASVTFRALLKSWTICKISVLMQFGSVRAIKALVMTMDTTFQTIGVLRRSMVQWRICIV